MRVLDRILRRGQGGPPEFEEVTPPGEVPSCVFLFGPTWLLHVGMRLDFADDSRPWGMRMLSDRPSLFNHYGVVGSPADRRIWRLTPDDPSTVCGVPQTGFWTCRSATIVEELAPTVVEPAWEDLVILCRRLAGLTHEEVIRIAPLLDDPGTRSPVPDTEFGRWADWAVGSAAREADTAEHSTMRYYRAGGGSYEDIVDPSWLVVETAAVRLADGLAIGATTLTKDGTAFGRWDSPE